MIEKRYDVAVIGGGPAGMMSAGQAASSGAKVILIEKNKQLGKKLLITGKGRCNITHAEFEMRPFIDVFGSKGKFLYSALSFFGVQQTLDFFESYGVSTKVERGDRIFPQSDNAGDIRDALVQFLNENKVSIINNAVVSLSCKNRKINKIILSDQTAIEADNFIIATGGLSYPSTGSTGDGYTWARQMGHTVITPSPALVPVICREKWIKNLEGLSLKNVHITVYKDNKKQDERFGEALFTYNGMSGPVILDMSKKIGELFPGNILLKIDFKPALDYPKLDKRIQRDFNAFHNKLFKNSLNRLLPKKIIPVFIHHSRIDPEKKVNHITKEERKRLLHLFKEFTLHISCVDDIKKAIVTSGGIALEEIDPKTMRSKLIDNLFFAGEILNLDGPTGGYNLQICWSTGALAGSSI